MNRTKSNEQKHASESKNVFEGLTPMFGMINFLSVTSNKQFFSACKYSSFLTEKLC